MKKAKVILSIIFYTLFAITILIYAIVTLNSDLNISRYENLFLLCSSCLFLYFGGLFYAKYQNDNKAMKTNLWIFFVLYLLLWITLTLFDQDASRNWNLIFTATKEQINNYINNRINLIPFNTIIGYIKNYNNLLDSSALIINVYGNFIACMPFSFFLPMLFKKQNKFISFLITIILIVTGIEIIQFITLSGSFDIDDFILNISGALFLYTIIRVNSINNLLKNIFLLTNLEINIKTLIKTVGFALIFFIGSILLIQKIASHYYYDYDEHNRLHNSDITFEYDDSCSDNNYFYEDKLYKYYFSCYDEETFYAIVNGKKYKIKDLLDNSEYQFDIDRILDRMKYYNIEFLIEHKWPHYNLEVKIDDIQYSIPSDYEDDFVKIIIKEKEDSIFELNFTIKTGTHYCRF